MAFSLYGWREKTSCAELNKKYLQALMEKNEMIDSLNQEILIMKMNMWRLQSLESDGK